MLSAYHRNSFQNEYEKPVLDFHIEKDRRLVHNKLVNVPLLKKERKSITIDVVYAFGARVNLNDLEKVEKCRSLKKEIAITWHCSNLIFDSVLMLVLGTIKVFFSPIKKIETGELFGKPYAKDLHNGNSEND